MGPRRAAPALTRLGHPSWTPHGSPTRHHLLRPLRPRGGHWAGQGAGPRARLLGTQVINVFSQAVGHCWYFQSCPRDLSPRPPLPLQGPQSLGYSEEAQRPPPLPTITSSVALAAWPCGAPASQPPSRCPLAGLSPFPLTPPHSPPALSPAPQLVSHSFHHPLCPSSTTRGGLKDKTGLDHLFPDPPRPPHSGPQDYSLVLADLCAPFDHLATLVLATSDTPTACTA